VAALRRKRKRQRPCGPWRSPGVLPVHWITHRPFQPCDADPGSPRFPHRPPQPVMRLRIHWLLRRPPSRVTPRLDPSVAAGSGIIEAIRISHPSAPRAVTRRVAPAFTLPVAPWLQALGFPSTCSFRLGRRRTFEAIQRVRPSAAPTERSRVSPYRVRSVSPKTSLRVSPHLRPPAPGDEAHRVSSAGSPSGFARENLRVAPNLLWPLASPTFLAPVSPWRFGPSEAPTDSSSVRPDSLSFGSPSVLPRVAPALHLRLGR